MGERGGPWGPEELDELEKGYAKYDSHRLEDRHRLVAAHLQSAIGSERTAKACSQRWGRLTAKRKRGENAPGPSDEPGEPSGDACGAAAKKHDDASAAVSQWRRGIPGSSHRQFQRQISPAIGFRLELN